MRKRIVLLAGSMLVGTTIGVVVQPVAATAAPLTSTSVSAQLSPAGCPALALGGIATGEIQVGAQTDCYSFPGATGDRIRVRLVETLGTLWAEHRVLRPDGTEVCGRNVYRDSTCVLDRTGIHQVRVRDDAGTALGKYSLNIQRLNDPVGCAVLPYGETVSDSIAVPAQTNCWAFSGVSGKVIRIRAKATYAIVNPETEVIRPDGSTVCAPATSWERTCTLDASGTHILLGKDNPGTGIGKYDLTVSCDTAPCGSSADSDFDGDGMADVAVFRPSTGAWYIDRSTLGTSVVSWGGAAGDVPATADFDGDGKADVAVFRPSTGIWYVSGSATGTGTFNWGGSGDIPVAADYDGDRKADLAVYRPSTGVWYISRSTGGSLVVNWGGASGDVPAPADYDGDRKVDVAVFRPSNGVWYVNRSTGGTTAVNWGGTGDIPVAADYDGDRKADIGVYRPSNGVWYVNRSTGGTKAVNFGGATGDVPVTGDYDGDGKADVGVFRSSSGRWLISRSTAGFTASHWGEAGDIPQ